MVAAQVVLAGGAGAGSAECASIYAQFNPPIVSGTYSSVSSSRQEHVREHGDASPFKNQQSEHFIPNSNFMEGPGRTGPTVPGAGNYSEGTGFTYNVYDDQSQGTEHKWLTDAERDFATRLESQGQNATAGEWLDNMEGETEKMLDNENLQRTKGGEPRSRINDAKSKSAAERKALAKAAAKCLRMEAEQQLKKQGVSLDTPLRNGQAGGRPPAAPNSGAASVVTGLGR